MNRKTPDWGKRIPEADTREVDMSVRRELVEAYDQLYHAMDVFEQRNDHLSYHEANDHEYMEDWIEALCSMLQALQWGDNRIRVETRDLMEIGADVLELGRRNRVQMAAEYMGRTVRLVTNVKLEHERAAKRMQERIERKRPNETAPDRTIQRLRQTCLRGPRPVCPFRRKKKD